MDDLDLLEAYVRLGSMESLNELARRHLGMVNAAALRQVRDPHLADDVTQRVFVELMRCAARIRKNVVLAGWLFNTTRFTASRMLRAQRRRDRHEKEAGALRAKPGILQRAESTDQLVRLLDDVIAQLPSRDRDAVVLHYLQSRSYRQVGAAQHVSEEAARKRVLRAVGRLRKKFGDRGVVISSETLGALLPAITLHAPPAELAQSIEAALRWPRRPGESVGLAYTRLRFFFMRHIKTMTATFMTAVLILGAAGAWRMHMSSAGTTPASPHDGPGSTPLATMFNALDAVNAGKGDALVRCFDGLTPEMDKQLREIASGVGLINQLKDAIAKKLGDQQAQNMLVPLGLLPPINYDMLQQAKTTIQGDAAHLSIQRLGVVPFKKVGNMWLFAPQTARMFPSNFAHIDLFFPQIQKLIEDVKAGKFASEHELHVALNRLGATIQNADTSWQDLPERPKLLAAGSTPRETVAASYWASRLGDETGLLACMINPNDLQKRQLHRHVEISRLFQGLLEAISENFGDRQAHFAGLTLGADSGLTGSLLKKATVTENGNRAHIDLQPSGISGFDLEKIDGVWKINPSFLPPPNPAWVAHFMEHYAPVLKQMTADLKDGKYEMFAQLQKAMTGLHEDLKADYAKYFPPNSSTRPA